MAALTSVPFLGPIARFFRKPKVAAWTAVAVLVCLVLILVLSAETPGIAVAFAIASAVCVLAKELLAVFAHDASSDRKKSLEGWAVVASFYAVVFGVPAVTVAVKTLLP
jgi:inner membrane protein involved in colicin E2 resistance